MLATAIIKWFGHLIKKKADSNSVGLYVMPPTSDATDHAVASVRQPCLVTLEGALL